MANNKKAKIMTKKGRPLPLGVTKNNNNVNFAIAVQGNEDCRLNIYRLGCEEKEVSILLNKEDRVGDIYSVELIDFNADEYEYNYEIKGKEFVDTYAKSVHGSEHFGKYLNKKQRSLIRGGFEFGEFDWQGDKPLEYRYSDLIMYKAHVRGFTKHTSSKVKNKGRYAGIIEKISYLKEIGINAIELMPTYEFNEIITDKGHQDIEELIENVPFKVNYWGYGGAVSYFAPKASYAASAKSHGQVTEFKELVKALHDNGIEIILEFYFEYGTNKGLILDCLRYWVLEYHIDGFHVNSEVVPTKLIGKDPVLAHTKLLTQDWNIQKIYSSEYVPANKNLAEYNDGFLVDVRRFLKSDEGQVENFIGRMRKNDQKQAVINYITNHNGFTLVDLYSYDIKHNEGNGELNRDGTEYNYSWNCGFEGKTRKYKIIEIRKKQIRNALITLIFSQGVPMLLAGDEMGNTQDGNNNAYCQDNEISWLNWNLLKTNKDTFEFIKKLIILRKNHPILHKEEGLRIMDYISCGSPDISLHGLKAWYPDYSNYSRIIGVMLCGKYAKMGRKDDNYFYLAFNMYWDNREFDLPKLPKGMKWRVLINTAGQGEYVFESGKEPIVQGQKKFEVKARSIVVFIGKE